MRCLATLCSTAQRIDDWCAPHDRSFGRTSITETRVNTAHANATSLRNRPGFTLVELLIALLLLDCALLALVGTSALITRWLGTAANGARAGSAAAARIERLASLSCSTTTSGETIDPRGMHEWWIVQLNGDDTRLLADSVEYHSAPGTRHLAAAGTRTLC